MPLNRDDEIIKFPSRYLLKMAIDFDTLRDSRKEAYQ